MDVLIVEDDAALGRLWSLAAQKAGHAAVHVTNAASARLSIRNRPADVILLDLNLGGESGLSIATLATYANPRCRIVVVTGSKLFPHGELFGMDSSIAAVLRKPVELPDMLAVLEHHGGDGPARAPHCEARTVGAPA